MFGDGSKAAAIESAIVFPNPSSHSHFHPIPPSYSPIPQSHSHRTLTLPPSTPSKSNSIPAPNQMDDPSPALFITGGLFLEPTIPNSLLNSVVSFKKNSPSSAVVSGAGSSYWCRLRAVAGGGFLSVSLNGDGVVRESKGCLVQNGDESSEETAPAVVTERKREKVGVRSRRAMNTTNHLWAGAIAAMVSRTFVAPLERLKLEYIVRGEQRHLFELVKTIAANQGLRGFWKGNLVNILRTAPFKAINFYAYDTYRKQLLRFSGNKETTNFERFVAGAAAGITAATLCLPLDTVSEFRIRPFDQSLAEMGSFFQIRTQLVAPGGEALGGVIGAFRHMIQTEGFFSLYKGLVPSIASMAPAGAVFYGVYDILKSTYLHSHDGRKRIHKMSQQGRGRSALDQLELGPVRTLLYGAISGACAEAATYPFEVVRRQLQLQVQATKMNALATGIKIVEHGGVPALYAGLIPSLLQVLPSAAISYFVYEFMKIVLKVE